MTIGAGVVVVGVAVVTAVEAEVGLEAAIDQTTEAAVDLAGEMAAVEEAVAAVDGASVAVEAGEGVMISAATLKMINLEAISGKSAGTRLS